VCCKILRWHAFSRVFGSTVAKPEGFNHIALLEMALNELGEKMGLETKTLQSFLSSRGAKLERSEEDIYNAVSKEKTC